MLQGSSICRPVKRGRFSISWKLEKRFNERLSREKGTVRKDPGGRLRVCLVYPNTYRVAMSNLGFQTLYRLFNDDARCVCERAFLPDRDEIEWYGERGARLVSLESRSPLGEFDIIAFSVSFEEDYVNIPSILELSGLSVFSSERDDGGPLVMAGGCAVSLNPEPVADFMDLFFIGEAEAGIRPFLDVLSSIGHAGVYGILRAISGLEGFYVPRFCEFTYDGYRVESIRPLEGMHLPVKRARVDDIDSHLMPESVVVTPDTEFGGVHLMEIERGCGRGCRFCTAGFLYLPPRWRDPEEVKRAVEHRLGVAGRLGLVGAAVSEYPALKDLLGLAVQRGGEITVSSLRADLLDRELLGLLKKTGYRTITIAPEAGSERLRRAVNKDIPDSTLLDCARLAAEAGFKRLKLYFMVGLPTEVDDDARAIGELALGMKRMLKGGRVILSINPFVPKPLTPFQWHGFEKTAVIERRYSIVKDILKREGAVEVKLSSIRQALVQAYLSRADRRAGRTILEASRIGWRRALKGAVPDCEGVVHRERERDELFAWDVLDHGLDKAYLWKEYQRGLAGRTTPPCDVGRCTRCGICH